MSQFSVNQRVYHTAFGPGYPATVYAFYDYGWPMIEFDRLPPGRGPSQYAGEIIDGALIRNERCFGAADSWLRPLPVQPKPAESPTREELIARVAELEADLATVQETHARAGQLVSDLRRENERLDAETAALGQERDRMLDLLREALPMVEDARDEYTNTVSRYAGYEHMAKCKQAVEQVNAADNLIGKISALAAHPTPAQEVPGHLAVGFDPGHPDGDQHVACAYTRDEHGVWHGACGKATATGSRELLPTTCAWCKRPVEVRE